MVNARAGRAVAADATVSPRTCFCHTFPSRHYLSPDNIMVAPAKKIVLLDNRFRITRELGRGALGRVYEAQDAAAQPIALGGGPFGGGDCDLQCSVELIDSVNAVSPSAIAAHLRTIQSIDHPHLLAIQQIGSALPTRGQAIYLVTNSRADSLDRHLSDAVGLSQSEVESLLSGISAGLAHLHARGIAHGALTAMNAVRVAGQWKLAPPAAPLAGAVWNDVQRQDILALGMLALRCIAPAAVGTDGAVQLDSVPSYWRRFVAMCLAPSDCHSAAELHLELQDGGRITAAARTMLEGFQLTPARTPNGIRLTWPPVACQVRLFALAEGREVHRNQVILAADLQYLGHPLPLDSGESAILQLALDQTVRVSAVLALGPIAVAAEVVTFSGLQDVRDLRASLHGRMVWLDWQWPDGITAAAIAVRTDRFPRGPWDAPRVLCPRTRFSISGGIAIEPQGDRVFACVYSALNNGNAFIYSAPGARLEILLPPDSGQKRQNSRDLPDGSKKGYRMR